jgi:casein kinase II subunit beta
MYEKYQNADFGRCHRVLCQGQPVLPWGQSDVPLNTTVNIFCPNCKEVYFPNSKRQGNIDGAYFGTTFAHLFLMIHPELVPPVYTKSFVPRVYGFKIHSSSPYWNKKS